MIGIGPERTAYKPVRLVLVKQHRADEGAVAPHLGRCDIAGQAVPLTLLVIGLRGVGDSVVVVEAGDLDVASGLKPKAERCDLLRNHVRPPDQDWRCKALVYDHLCRTKNTVVLAFRVHNSLAAG